MSEDLLSSQPLMWVHMKHMGHQVLKRAHVNYETCKGDRLEPSLDMELNLGISRHSVPVSSSQTEVTIAYPVQDLIGGVLRSIGKRSKADGRNAGR